jgi:hypothetical protein
MTRQAYNGCVSEKLAEVRRILDRYLVEVVEAYDLCPWARTARTGGELAVEVLFGEPSDAAWVEAAATLLARRETRVAMVVAPETAMSTADLRALRDRVAARIPSAGIAHFHPEAPLDLASPARLVPFLRRSPDPLLQLVPLALLDTVRGAPPAVDRVQQAQMLLGQAAPPRGDVADRIAATNHTRVSAEADALVALLDEIARDRRESYARVGLRSSR